MEAVFKAFAQFGTKNDGATITLSNSDKWLKQAGILDNKSITTTDTAICFNKFKSRTLDYKQFLSYIEALAKEKKTNPADWKAKLTRCSTPGAAGATKVDKAGIVERMTDTSRYTGAHKQRFDAGGKGRGIEGRQDRAENSGYVGAYKNKGTYNKTH